MMEKYPFFIFPNQLYKKRARQWNKNEAKLYFEWLLDVIEDRTDYLIKRLGLIKYDKIENHLQAMGEMAVELLNTDDFSDITYSGRKLNSRGYALAADMGLLVARFLTTNFDAKISWKILKKPKSEASYNLPVLTGFTFGYFDPVEVSIANAHAMLRGDCGSDKWKELYLYCRENVCE